MSRTRCQLSVQLPIAEWFSALQTIGLSRRNLYTLRGTGDSDMIQFYHVPGKEGMTFARVLLRSGGNRLAIETASFLQLSCPS